jgi:MinD-like ATPase involved in chromosome partitioning or flagellar assembly
MGDRLPVLVAAAGQPWEARAIELIARDGLALQKRCVDLPDLVATATTGLAAVAVASADLPGLDADSVDALRRAGVGTVLVHDDATPADRLQRLGVDELVGEDLGGLVAALRRAGGPQPVVSERRAGHGEAQLVAVFGPGGAPGRTTVATGLAAALADRGHGTFLLDADPYGGAVAQHLGVLDEVSGLLAAARTANAGQLDSAGLAGLARTVGEDLRVLTGLPRADRWAEVRPAAFAEILDAAATLEPWVVVDVGFSLEEEAVDPFEVGPQRNGMTLAALERADQVTVVGAADPVGLARLARALVDLRDHLSDAAVHVVVNRSRPSLGWSEGQLRTMVADFLQPASVTVLPEDRGTADRALMAGLSLVELGDSPLRRGVAALAAAVLHDQPIVVGSRWWRRRRS